MALPRRVDRDGSQCFHGRDALLGCQYTAAPSFISRTTAFSTQRNGSMGRDVLNPSGANSQALVEGGAAGIDALWPVPGPESDPETRGPRSGHVQSGTRARGPAPSSEQSARHAGSSCARYDGVADGRLLHSYLARRRRQWQHRWPHAVGMNPNLPARHMSLAKPRPRSRSADSSGHRARCYRDRVRADSRSVPDWSHPPGLDAVECEAGAYARQGEGQAFPRRRNA